MTIEELLKALGIADDKKETAEKELKSFLDGSYVPKSRFNEVNEEKNTLKKTVAERDEQLKTLQQSAEGNEDLKKEIKNLQELNKAASEKAEKELNDFKLTAAIKLAVSSSAQDADLVAGLIDRGKLVLSEDGKISGLDEQIKALQQDKSFLFKAADSGRFNYNPGKGDGVPTDNPFSKEHFNFTAQNKLIQDNPEKARALATEAGVTVDF